MSIKISVPQDDDIELKPRITVVGVGGAGGNAVNNMINANLDGVEFMVANTDAQALSMALAGRKVQLGGKLTQGLGAGSKPEIGRAAAEETIEEINEHLRGSHMVFIAAGMGGGTGTGAAPVIARAARDLGILTVGVVTKPFQFEGLRRQRLADKGIEELEQYVDTLIIIPNQNLFRVASEKTTFSDAFRMADNVLYSGVRGVTDLMVMPGLINLDFADIRSVMSEMGKAMMGTGEAEGERRALEAAEAAISNPLLDDTSMAGAKGVLINITGGLDMTLYEVDEATNRIRQEVDDDAYIIFGSTFDQSMEGRLRVSVVATGIEAEAMKRAEPSILDMAARSVAAKTAGSAAMDDAAEVAMGSLFSAEIDTASAPAAAQQQVLDLPESAVVDGDEVTAAEIMAVFEDETDAPAAEAVFTAPAAMPSAMSEDAFITPMPGKAAAKADPMAEAAMVNGATEQKPKEDAPKRSLFERVTGGARGKVTFFGHAKSEKSAPAVSKPAAQLRSTGGAEPVLGGLDLQEKVQPSKAEDDFLDIPAFLRRQAN
ncbi:MAG: cell division protein FtsZ [Alphaproteobacteria bacterium]|nr:cell division protein FtsZ [Alphaproteobacteria bacterium]